MPETRVDLLRHGQCQGGEIFRGALDVALTDEGWAAMDAQVATHAPAPWERIVSSPLRRCERFARAAAERLMLPLSLEPGLREMHFGQWEGREYTHLWNTDPQLARWGEDPERYTPPGGEPLADFAERVNKALTALVTRHPGEHLLLVTHGGVIRLLLAQAHEQPRRSLRQFHVPYAHFSSLVWTDGRLRPWEDEAP
ncbi:histidine phosphatase family protein [Marinimicrobium alkaliphilum]|uniref:histidine phosphatase family protein n=1 Tax=Marinimicrobium alkaliphilum TaxID=2202654 RepID=UPI000DB8FCBC|nr:alpha-ribazole phosphatase family protein [Marinimicrobium alkaliphilum]